MLNPLRLFKKTSQKPEHFIALYFGTTSTKAFIFSLDDQIQLLGQGQGTATEAIEQASAQAGFRPTQAVVGIGGENCWCLTTTVRFNRPEPEKEVAPKEIEKLKEQIFRTALMQATPQMAEFLGDPELTLQLIDSETLLQKSGDGVLESSIFTAHSPTLYLRELTANLKNLNLNLWAVCSLMSILVKTLANDNLSGFNAIIMDVGGKVTDIAVVFGGGIWGTRPLSLGGETFTRALSQTLKLDYKEAEEKKVVYAGHQLRDEEVPNLKDALQPALELWLIGVETALQNFEGVKTFPNRIILTGGGARLDDLKEGLAAYPLMRSLPFASPPLVEVRTDVGPQNMKLVAREILGGSDAT